MTGNELARIKSTIHSSKPMGKQTATDLVLDIQRLRPEDRNSDIVINRVTDYFHKKGETSLNKWQINAIVRQTMATRVSVSHDDLAML